MRILVLLLFASIASAQQTPTSINSLPAAAPLTGTEAIPCEQGGTKKCTVAQITTQTASQLYQLGQDRIHLWGVLAKVSEKFLLSFLRHCRLYLQESFPWARTLAFKY